MGMNTWIEEPEIWELGFRDPDTSSPQFKREQINTYLGVVRRSRYRVRDTFSGRSSFEIHKEIYTGRVVRDSCVRVKVAEGGSFVFASSFATGLGFPGQLKPVPGTLCPYIGF